MQFSPWACTRCRTSFTHWWAGTSPRILETYDPPTTSRINSGTSPMALAPETPDELCPTWHKSQAKVSPTNGYAPAVESPVLWSHPPGDEQEPQDHQRPTGCVSTQPTHQQAVTSAGNSSPTPPTSMPITTLRPLGPVSTQGWAWQLTKPEAINT